MLIDDYNRSASSREHDRKLGLLSELLQMTDCGGDILLDEDRMDFSRTALIITAEERIDSASSTTRALVIKLTGPFNAKDLTYLQNNRHLYTHFLKKFILWLCQNASWLTREIQKMILASNFSMSVEHDNAEQYIGFARISSLHLLMKIAQCLLTTFLSCHISESSCKEIYAQLDNGIKTAVKDTLEAVRSTEHSSEILDAVIKVFRCDNEHIVADDYDEYREDDNHKIFFKYKREYFFKAEGLAAYLNRKTGKRYSGKAILSELDELLTFTSEGVSRHLPRKLRKIKPKNNKRFSALSEDVLIDRIVSKSSSYFDYCSSPINKLRQNNF